MDGREEQLVAVSRHVGLRLQREQLVSAQVALIVARAGTGENRLGQVVDCHARSILRCVSDLFSDAAEARLSDVAPQLGQAFGALLRERGLNVVEVYRDGREHEDLYQLAELLISLDEQVTLWRARHYLVVARVIGDEVVGTQGTPVELLGGLIKQKFFPELWQARNRLTALANDKEES